MDSITLTGVSAQGTHGVLDFEHERAQTFVVDAQIFLDLSKAGFSDSLADTVDYGQIAARIVSAIEGRHLDLIEALAARIADSILRTDSIRRVIVTVHKPAAPITVPFADVAVTLERSKLASDNLNDDPFDHTVSFSNVENNTSDVESSTPRHAKHRQAPPSAASAASAAASTVGVRDDSPEVIHKAIIAMGGNLGDPVTAMRSTVVSLDGIPGNQIMGISPLYRTTPWGMEEATPDFLNAVVELNTTMEPMELLLTLQMIEAAHGRSREVHWGSRPLDLDIIDFDGMVSTDTKLTLPHPRAWQRAFVLAPLHDLLPSFSLPGEHGGPVATLLQACPDKGAVQRVSDDWILGSTASWQDSKGPTGSHATGFYNDSTNSYGFRNDFPKHKGEAL